ncbi:MAG: ABC-type multidrug transport system, ATPase and permease component [Anaerocolumna sp.]|nr:ABC-type multidrug transport system, ATPase and permease component [Anaerocolumna sp.]
MIAINKYIKDKIKSNIFKEIFQESKWLYQYTKRYWRSIIYYIFLGILSSGLGLAGSVSSKYLIDAVTGHEVSNLGFIITLIISMAFGNIIIRSVTGRISAKISLKVTNEIQADIYSKIMGTDWESMSQYHSGDLLSRLNGDVNIVAESVIGWIPTLITRLGQFLGTLAVILYYDSTMAVLALLSAPITMIMSKILVNRMRNYNKNMKQVSSNMMAFHEESFHNIQTIKCFDLVGFFGKRLKNVQKKYADIALEYNKFSIYTSFFMSVVGIVVSYTTFGWGVYRLWGGYITYGTMTLFLQLSSGLASGFSALVGMVPSAISAATSAGRIMSVVELPREKEEDSSIVDKIERNAKSLRLAVQLSDISFHYSGRSMILQHASIYANPQEIVAIIGPSGEGKTTLIRILLGLLNPTAGKARIVDEGGLEARLSSSTRRFFSYVPQGNTIFSGTIADNLRMVRPEADEQELITALKAACAYAFVKELPEGIYTKVGEKGCGFSEGQAQRLAIARAILRDAPILLLDEATSALDTETEKEVLRGIMAYGKTHTCILTTHRFSVLNMCDRVYQMKEGEIMEFLHKDHELIAVNL